VMKDESPRPDYPPAALAAANLCKPGSSPEFFDDFAPPDPGWGAGAQARYFESGKMVLKPKAAHSEWWSYEPLVFRNAAICADVAFPALASAHGAAGILFWAADPNNYYVSGILPDGNYWVMRKVAGEWALVVPHAKSSAIRAGPGAVNRMKVILNESSARIEINGTHATEFRGQPPKDGGRIGFYAESENATDAEWRFQNLVVVK
jgi:hypothetical protein